MDIWQSLHLVGVRSIVAILRFVLLPTL